MRLRAFSIVLSAGLMLKTAVGAPNESPSAVSAGTAVIREMNLARQHPGNYAKYLSTLRERYHGNVFVFTDGSLLRAQEGVSALDEAVRFLRHAPSLAPLANSPGMSRAAADQVADQAGGAFGHVGSDASDPATRLNRHGTWGLLWGENVSYGKTTAREIVAALIIDDGLPGRKHRKNIFNAAFNFAGAAIGPHARYRTVCSIEFAGNYVERGQPAANTLFARN